MKIGRIRAVGQLCAEVLRLCSDLEGHEQVHGAAPGRPADNHYIVGPNPIQAALRRRSLDLTRALAIMRRTQ